MEILFELCSLYGKARNDVTPSTVSQHVCLSGNVGLVDAITATAAPDAPPPPQKKEILNDSQEADRIGL